MTDLLIWHKLSCVPWLPPPSDGHRQVRLPLLRSQTTHRGGARRVWQYAFSTTGL